MTGPRRSHSRLMAERAGQTPGESIGEILGIVVDRNQGNAAPGNPGRQGLALEESRIDHDDGRLEALARQHAGRSQRIDAEIVRHAACLQAALERQNGKMASDDENLMMQRTTHAGFSLVMAVQAQRRPRLVGSSQSIAEPSTSPVVVVALSGVSHWKEHLGILRPKVESGGGAVKG